MTAPALSREDFEFVRSYIHEKAALVLEADKQYLVEARLTPLTRQIGVTSIGQLVGRLRLERSGPLGHSVVEAMTTNETSWFRDIHPFEALRTEILPPILAARQAVRRLTIWCAACSSGQEPYTIGMMLKKHFPELGTWSVKILASDISTQMVERTRRGRYSQLEVNRGLPAPYLPYFRRDGLEYEIDASLRGLIDAFPFNLATPWPRTLPTVDIVFLRNVMIYFDVPTKKTILARMRGQMAADGALFLGGAESTLNLDDQFERVPLKQASCYRIKAK